MSVKIKCYKKAVLYQVLPELDILSSYVWSGYAIYLKDIHHVFVISMSGAFR